MGWRLTVRGHTLDESRVTAAHLVTVSTLAERDEWVVANPMHSPRVLVSWASVVLAGATEMTLDDALLFTSNIPIADLIRGFEPEAPEPEAPVEGPGPDRPPSAVLADLARRLAERERQE